MQQQRVLFGIIATVLIIGTVFSGCTEQQPPSLTSEDLARDIVTLLGQQKYTAVYGFFIKSVQSQLTVEQLQSSWEQLLSSFGDFKGIIQTRLTNETGYDTVYVSCNFSKTVIIDIRIVFDNESRIIGFNFLPTTMTYPYNPPSYVDQSMFSETNVTIGTDPWTLPGTLTVPKGSGPFPAVVLVQGSGTNDRDETIGPNKPFKDIAWGLATNGIAVLRYEKRTKQYPDQVAEIQNFTVQDETIDDVIVALDFLNTTAMVDPARLYVVGHSLGGMLAPQIATQDPRIDGLIILAGPTRHLEDLILNQTRYLLNQSGTMHEQDAAQLAEIEQLVMKIKTLNFSDDEYILGAKKPYWAYLATYDPVTIALPLNIPMLIVQGERDFQVTMVDFARWDEAFSVNQNVTLKSYPTLNHLFVSGTGPSTNNDYLMAGHVAEEVINDVAAWVNSQ